MAGLEFQILCHSIGILSFLIACIFITAGICLQVFDPEDNTDNPLPWRTDSFALTFIGAFALIVFIVYFCHVARRQWKIFNVISIRPHYKRKKREEVEGWHEEDKNKAGQTSEKSDETGEVDGMTPAQAYSREFSMEDTESSVSENSQKQLVRKKPPRQGKYKLPRQTSEISDESDNYEIVPSEKFRKDKKLQKPIRRPRHDSPKSSIRDYVIRSNQRYSVNEPKRDHRVEAKAKADKRLMDSLGEKDDDGRKYVIQPTKKSFRKIVQANGAVPTTHTDKFGIDNEAYVIQPRDTQRDSKKYPNGILKKSSTDGSDTHQSDDVYVVQSRRQRKYQKRSQGAMRHSSQKVIAGGADENSLDKPSWVATK